MRTRANQRPANRRLANRRLANRRGIASLEFVMGTPFLIALGGVIVMAGFAGVARLDAVINARKGAWAKRSKPAYSSPLYVLTDADAGKIVEEKTNNVKTYTWLGGNHQASSKAALIAGTWDHRQITDFNNNRPHIHLLANIGIKNENLRGLISLASAMALSAGSLLPNSEEIQDAQDQTNQANDDANDQVDQANEEIDGEIGDRRQQIQELETQIQQLEAKRAQKEQELETARANASAEQNRLEQLEAEAATYGNMSPPEPVPQSLLDQIADSRRKRDGYIAQANRLEGEIAEINREIGRKQQRIRVLEEEIRQIDATRPG